MVEKVLEIPRWARCHFDDEKIRILDETVSVAEHKTEAEIVPMIVRRSTPMGVLPHLLLWWPALVRFLIPKHDQEYSVHTRAAAEFFRCGLVNTQRSTGVLLFVSLLERRVVVLADRSIIEKLPNNTWDQLVEEIIQLKKNKNLTDALTHGISKLGTVLGEHFPIQHDDRNELSNKLILSE